MMRVRSLDDLVYALIARLPLFLLVGGFIWFMVSGMHYIDRVLINNQGMSSAQTSPVSQEQLLLDALNSGDTARMTAALAEVEARSAAQAPAVQY